MWPRMSHCDHLPGAPRVLGPMGGPSSAPPPSSVFWRLPSLLSSGEVAAGEMHLGLSCNYSLVQHLASSESPLGDPLQLALPGSGCNQTSQLDSLDMVAWWWAVMESIWSCEDHRWRVHCSAASCTATASCSYQTVQPVSLEIGMGNSLVSFPAPSV